MNSASGKVLRILGIAGSNSSASKTQVVVEAALGFVRETEPSARCELIALGDSRLEFCDGRDPGRYEGATREAIDAVLRADALIVGSPMYRGSYPGVLKNLFDLLPNDALEGKVVGLVATGGSDHHYLAIEHELRPLLSFFRAHTVPGSVYAHNGHFAHGILADDAVEDRLRGLARSTVELARALPRSVYGADGPAIPRLSLAES